jgi:hypothetical protein
MIQRVKAAVQKFRDLPEDSTVKTKIRSGKAWAIERCQKFRSFPTGRQLKIIGFTCGGICVLGLLSLAMPDQPAPIDRPVASAPTQEGRRSLMTNQGYIGAWSESDLDLVIRAARQNDTDAVASLMADDRAFWIPANRAVDVRGSGGFLVTRVEARFVGDTRYFWTVSEAIH